jgi:hypothetical protein
MENQDHLYNAIGPQYLENMKNAGKVMLVDTGTQAEKKAA